MTHCNLFFIFSGNNQIQIGHVCATQVSGFAHRSLCLEKRSAISLSAHCLVNMAEDDDFDGNLFADESGCDGDEDMLKDMYGEDEAAEDAAAEGECVAVTDDKGGKNKGAADGVVLLCLICGVNQRNNKQWICSAPCGGDVRAAERDAKQQGQQAHIAFKKLRKKGGTEFVKTVNVYKAKCSGFGRGFKRPAFEWVRY